MAVELSSITRADPPCPPSDRLLHIMIAGMEKQIEAKENNIYDENTAGIGLFYIKFQLLFDFYLIKKIILNRS